MNRYLKAFLLVLITGVVTAIVTFRITTAYFTGFLPFQPQPATKLNQVIRVLEQAFYKPTDQAALVEGAVRGAVDSLGDPYTTYMDKKEWEEFNSYITGSYSGIGLTVTADSKDDTIMVVSTFADSPAAQAGIKTGDKILKVDGSDVTGGKIDDAVAKMKGKTGTETVLTLRKKDTQQEETLTLKRQEIKMTSVESELKGDIGYIRIDMFDSHTGTEFKQHLDTVTGNGAKSLVIDLRQNSGGLTSSAEEVANLLLPADCTIFYTADRQGKQTFYKTKGGGVGLPVVVLIDEGTASAAEILAAAVRDNNRGTLVGKKSFGKGLVQQPYGLSDGSVVKVTVEQYFTPSGADINKKGIQPDHEVELKTEADEQLISAMELLHQ